MELKMEQSVLLKLRRGKRRRFWSKLMSVLMCTVMFCTTYALILPAITMEAATFCGIEPHTHTAECYPAQGEPTCGLSTEGEHLHTEECVAVKNLVCGLEESAGHTHDESCGMTEEKVLICTETEEPHLHDETCIEEGVNVCGLEETEGHLHGEECYAVTVAYSCGTEESEGHTHTDDCYEITYGCVPAEAHVHTAECYASALTCTEEESDTHTHSEECYSVPPVCGMTAHEHGLQCLSDPNADLETAAVWEASLPGSFTGVYAEDLLAVAASQLGYTESSKNYTVDESGVVRGYTRYGEWYGEPYSDWNAIFVSFCMHYAIEEDYPALGSASSWVSELRQRESYKPASDYLPKAGDIIFFDRDADGKADRMGLVESVVDTDAAVIEGDSENRVAKKTYELFDNRIIGYAVLAETEPTPEPPAVELPEDLIPEDLILDDTDAWAVLISPDGEMVTDSVEEEVPEVRGLLRSSLGAMGTYGLRNTASTYQTRAANLDLTPYIIAVTMYDEYKNPIPSGSVVTEGDLIEFQIEYTITGQQLAYMNGEDITVNSDTLVYNIPSTFKLVQSNSGNILNAAGVTVGTYEIDSNSGLITVTFSETYVKQNASGMQIHGKLSFFSTVTKVTNNDSENQEHQFKEGITLGVTVQEKVEAVGDLSIEKRKALIDGEEIVYEVTVSSENGTNSAVVITDTMSEGLTFVESVGVWENGTLIKNVTFQPSADKSSFTLELPKMEAGDEYVVKYRCKADVDLLGADMSVRNTASVTSTNNQNVPLEDETTVEHTFDLLRKSGVKNDDGSITWTITVNSAKADISGWVLEDILHGEEYTGEVTLTDSKGNKRTVTLPYTFPNGSTDTYAVTYTTLNTSLGSTIYNSAILHVDKDTDVTVLTGVGVGSPIEKTGEAGEVMQDEDGNWVLPITWTVTIDTTNAAIPGYSWFYDSLYGWPSEDMYMTYDQLMDLVENFEAAILPITGQDVEGFSAQVLAPGEDNYGHAYNMIQLMNNADNCQSFKFEGFNICLKDKGIPQGKVLTFSYEAYGVFENNIIATSTFKNRFALGGEDYIESRVDYVVGAVNGTKYATQLFDPDAPTGAYDWKLDWNNIEGTSRYNYEDLHDSYLAWAIKLSVPPGYSSTKDVTVYEDLPDGVTVKGLDIPFFQNLPTGRLQLRDMVEGETYYWTFEMPSAEQYANWQLHYGKEVTITIKVTEEGDLEITVPGEVFMTMSDYIPVYNAWDWSEKVSEWYAYLHIYTQIDDDFEWPDGSTKGDQIYVNAFENRFTIRTEDGTVVDIGSQTQTVSKNESTGNIRKKATTDNSGIINYSVLLNAYGKDLVANSNVLAVHDVLTYTSTTGNPLRVRLVPGSVKLYEARVRSDGSYTKIGELTANYKYAESSAANNGTTTWTHTIDLNVPDDKPLVLEYSYRPTGKENVQHDIFNTCTISGVGAGSVEGDHKIEIEVHEAAAQANIDGVILYKVDADSDGIFLKDAKFNIYIWNKEQNKYIIVHDSKGNTEFVTNESGMIVLDKSTMRDKEFAYNTAYYIIEVESPNGYYISPEPYYFYIENTDTTKYPSCIPTDFPGRALTSGDIIYRQNVSALTEITIEKYWRDYGRGDSIIVTGDKVSEVEVELWQMIKNDPLSKKLYGTYTMTPDKDGNWSLTVKNLPKATRKSDGTRGADYLYYVKEVSVPGYSLESTENNDGINSGVIKLVNRETNGYELPETGGTGTKKYTMAGLLLVLFSTAYLMYNSKKRRREEP